MPKDTSNRDLIDVFSRALENPDVKLPEPEQTRLERMKAIFARWLSNPLITDSMMRDYIISNFGVGRIQAYRDIALVKVLFGHAPKADKEFQRMRANRLLEQAAAAALAGSEKQAKALTKIAEAIIKANQLDAQDGEDYPWEEIVPKDESFSVDPSVIGIEKVPDIEKKASRLLKQYEQELDDTIDDQQQ